MTTRVAGWVIALLRQLAPATAARDESAYWRLVLRYCRAGAACRRCWTSSGTCCGTRSRGPRGPRTPPTTRPRRSVPASSSRWCTRRVPVSTGSSFAPSEAHRVDASTRGAAQVTDAQLLAGHHGASGGCVDARSCVSAPCSPCASATSARTTVSTSARTPSTSVQQPVSALRARKAIGPGGARLPSLSALTDS